MFRRTFTTNFITTLQVQWYKINSINFFQQQGMMFEDIGAIAEFEHNEITSTWLLFLLSLCTLFISFKDFLLLGSLSPCTKTHVYRQTSIQIYFEVQTFLFFCFKCKSVQWLKLNEHMNMNMIKLFSKCTLENSNKHLLKAFEDILIELFH